VPAPRVLVLTADIGAGHDLPARLLAEAIRDREPGAEVVVADGLEAMGPLVRAVMRTGAETILERARPLFDLQYWLALRFPPTRWLAGTLLTLAGGRGVLALIRSERPDVIVSTYPGTTDMLGRLRALGRLPVPTVAAITDLAALRFWAHPRVDLHLLTHEESRPEVESIAGPDARIVAVTGLTRPEFEAPPARAAARADLGLPADAPVVLVSGGGWGMGDLEEAARAVLAIPDAIAVCLCGTNARLKARLEGAFTGDPRVRVEGFTERMAEWMAAADVLVHSTAGLTVLEAELCGTWAISYGWGVAHLRINNAAYRRLGLADVAGTPGELGAALRRALAAPRPRPDAYARRPAAADEVLALTASPRRRSAAA
jgi:processive 1,2-diacylglycerol beta-glucosyltransferase